MLMRRKKIKGHRRGGLTMGSGPAGAAVWGGRDGSGEEKEVLGLDQRGRCKGSKAWRQRDLAWRQVGQRRWMLEQDLALVIVLACSHTEAGERGTSAMQRRQQGAERSTGSEQGAGRRQGKRRRLASSSASESPRLLCS